MGPERETIQPLLLHGTELVTWRPLIGGRRVVRSRWKRSRWNRSRGNEQGVVDWSAPEPNPYWLQESVAVAPEIEVVVTERKGDRKGYYLATPEPRRFTGILSGSLYLALLLRTTFFLSSFLLFSKQRTEN